MYINVQAEQSQYIVQQHYIDIFRGYISIKCHQSLLQKSSENWTHTRMYAHECLYSQAGLNKVNIKAQLQIQSNEKCEACSE